MRQTDVPLYPKITSIYNKILQLGLATISIIVITNIWTENFTASDSSFDQHFQQIGNDFMQQTVIVAEVLLKAKKHKQLVQYIESLPKANIVFDAHLYDLTGQTIAKSKKSQSMNTLFGLLPATNNNSQQYVPFVQEIRNDKLYGYIRVTLIKEKVTDTLVERMQNQSTQFLLVIVLALLAGSITTRLLGEFRRYIAHLRKSRGNNKN